MKKLSCVFITVIALVLSGCSKAVTVLDMPEIVFMKFTDIYKYEFLLGEVPDTGRYSLEFLDKNGDYYITYSTEICMLVYDDEKLIERFKSGDERITKLPKSRDVDELLENYKKLLKAAANKEYELVYPEMMPDVMADSVTWYGLYYDKNVKLSALPIHKSECLTPIEANDDRANEIYKWYSGAASGQ